MPDFITIVLPLLILYILWWIQYTFVNGDEVCQLFRCGYTELAPQWILYHTLTARLEVRDGSHRLMRLIGATVSGAKALSDAICHCHKLIEGKQDFYHCLWAAIDAIVGSGLAIVKYRSTGVLY